MKKKSLEDFISRLAVAEDRVSENKSKVHETSRQATVGKMPQNNWTAGGRTVELNQRKTKIIGVLEG